jgi:uncharacterized protein (DUF1697 family)
MTRYVAFLRGINLGHRRVKMADLRGHFEELGLDGVGSYIASGNVIFDHESADVGALEDRIEARLEEALGFFTDTIIRPLESVDGLTRLGQIEEAEGDGFTVYATFAKEELGGEVEEAFADLETPDDRFHVREREVLWLRRGGISDSTIKTRHLEAAFGGIANTRRKVSTLRKMVERFSD